MSSDRATSTPISHDLASPVIAQPALGQPGALCSSDYMTAAAAAMHAHHATCMLHRASHKDTHIHFVNFPEPRTLMLTLAQAGAAARHAHLQQTTGRGSDHHIVHYRPSKPSERQPTGSDHHIEQITLSPPKGPSQRQGLARRNVTVHLEEHHRPDGRQANVTPLDRPHLHGTV